MIKLVKEYVINLKNSIIQEDFPGMASEMAFMLVLGIFPFMLFLMAVFGWLGKKFFVDKVIYFISVFTPNAVSELLHSVLKEVILFQNGGTMAVVGFIVTLILTSNAIAVIIKGLNRANKIQENRSFIKTRLLSVLMVFVNTFFFFISV